MALQSFNYQVYNGYDAESQIPLELFSRAYAAVTE